MADTILNYLINATWAGKRATDQAGRDLENLGRKGDTSAAGTKKATSAIGSLDSKIAGLVTGGALIAAGYMLADFAGEAISAASDVEEAYGKFNVVFGDFADSTEADLDAIAEASKRSKYDLIEYAATLQDTFVPLGFARNEAAEMSTQLVQLAVDLASFNNVAEADVVRDLQSALVGNTETLRKYGVVAQETQIKQEALALGLWDGTGAVDAQAKASAILSLAVKGTTDAQGDAERTADSYANTSRELDAALQDLNVTMGQRLLPAATETKARFAELIRQTIDFLESQFELEDELAKLHAAYEDGIITQDLYHKAAREIQYGMQNAGDAYYWANELIEQQAEYLKYLERDTLSAAAADEVLTQRVSDYTFAATKMVGIAAQEGRTYMQNADIRRGHAQAIIEETEALVEIIPLQEEAAAAYNQTYVAAFQASENADLAAVSYANIATDALLASSGTFELTEKSIDLMVALGEMTPEIAEARKEYAFMTTEMKAFAENAAFAALSIDRQAKAIQGLESGRYGSAQEAVTEQTRYEKIDLQYDNIADFYDKTDGITATLDEIEAEDTVPVIEVDTDPFEAGYDQVKTWLNDLAKGVTVPIRSRNDTGGAFSGNDDGEEITTNPNLPEDARIIIQNYNSTASAVNTANAFAEYFSRLRQAA